MAIIYGQDNYLENKKQSYFIYWGAFLFVLIFSVYFFAFFGFSAHLNLKEGLFAASAFLLFIEFLGLIISRQEIKFRKFKHGLDGENDICQILKELPDSYRVFRGMGFRAHCDIDFILAGPTGVFTVEVKSHKGRVGFNGSQLMLDGREFEKDFLRQAFAEAMDFKDYLFSITRKELFVEAIVVFSNDKASVHVEPRKVRNVNVVHKNDLLYTITSESEFFNAGQVEFIEEHLKNIMVEKYTPGPS